ncbi:MAG: SDR family NAD(P)-dependent oxidoreductase [Algoriphagus sp.]|uniref:SDR family NAD(P)-dependent oxidoreductase n=1 Tax=Algoriphagus sp. TaxID=1872435 RepID=UPI00261043BA|nr:SDR family NAD(P)-dependent oxidoreductase [Algoriphagus sp.]MDG1275923.1 SDR family NAD(P)-dependent oxidoreductase [Algoriphagus sp.]
MKILITGITGLFGSYLAKEFSELGEISGLVRRSSSKRLTESLESNIHWLEGDLADIDSLEAALQGIDLVIHAAGMVSFDSKDETSLYQTNVKGTANLVNAMLLAGVKKLVHISSVAAIGRSQEHLFIDENFKWTESPLNTVYANSKYYGELEAWRGEQEGLTLLVVNPSILLGKIADDRSSTDIYHYVLEENRYYPSGNINYIDVRDAAKITKLLVEKNKWGERFILNKESIPYQKFFQIMGVEFGKKAPYKALNPFLLHLVVFFNGIFRKLGLSKSPLNKKTALISKQKTVFENKKAQDLLNFEYFSLEDTFRWAR